MKQQQCAETAAHLGNGYTLVRPALSLSQNNVRAVLDGVGRMLSEPGLFFL